MKDIDIYAVYGYGVTKEQLNADGFFKVDERGGTYVVATYYNPKTDEEGTVNVRDYDYDRSHDNDSLYYDQINKKVERIWMHQNGAILDGDQVMVIKGRKVPKGTVHTVKGKKEIYDRFGRWICDYLVFTDGLATNIQNCIRVM